MAHLGRDEDLRRFKSAWNNLLDEDTKEVIAGALYTLSRDSGQVVQSHHLTKYALNEDRLDVLKRLTEYTQEN